MIGFRGDLLCRNFLEFGRVGEFFGQNFFLNFTLNPSPMAKSRSRNTSFNSNYSDQPIIPPKSLPFVVGPGKRPMFHTSRHQSNSESMAGLDTVGPMRS